jgi:ABC-type polysaccharide/polyol phosphate transport system ATPase subunit
LAPAGLDLVAHGGEVTAVLGPNGGGKTTFVRTIATLVRPGAGTLRVAGGSSAVAGLGHTTTGAIASGATDAVAECGGRGSQRREGDDEAAVRPRRLVPVPGNG